MHIFIHKHMPMPSQQCSATPTAYIVIAYIVMAYIVMACIVMAYRVMANIVMAYIVMAHKVRSLGNAGGRMAPCGPDAVRMRGG